jgi:cell division protein FtsW
MLLRSPPKTRQTMKRSERAQRLKAEPPSELVNQVLKDHRPNHHIDYFLLNIIILLMVMGLVSILSASAHVAQAQMGDASYYFKKQLVGVVLGLIGMFAASRIDIYKLPRWITPLMVVAIVLLLATHIPGIGITSKGSSRWIHLFGLVFQPSEIAKPVLVVYLATILGHPYARKLSLFEKGQILMPVGAILLLILTEPDLGTTIVVAGTVFIIYFAAGLPIWKAGALLGGGGLMFFLLSWSTPYQQARITSWLDPFSDPQGKGFHLIQSLIAIGSGGFIGNGFGQSVQKLFYLPEQHTDFIFAVISEEFGFIGVCVLLLMFILLAQRGTAIAVKSPTPYLKLLAMGLCCMTVMQAWVNLAVVSGSIPTTGLTLPFISFGSSSLIVNLTAMGLLLNISRYVPSALKPAPKPRPNQESNQEQEQTA